MEDIFSDFFDSPSEGEMHSNKQDIDDLNTLLGMRDEEIRILKKQHLYDLAEIENVKKHSRMKCQTAKDDANAEIISKILPIIDDFGRAQEHGELSEGCEHIYSKLMSTLNSCGLEKIETKGSEFNTDLHEAVSMIPSNGCESGIVMDCVQDGYTLNGKVIRYAKVVVSQ